MKKNNHRPPRLAVAPAAEPPPSAQLIISAWPDRPPRLQCTGDAILTLQLLASGLLVMAEMLQKNPATPQEVQDRPRHCLGPRDKPQNYDPKKE